MSFPLSKWSASERLALLIVALLLLLGGGIALFRPRSIGFSLTADYSNDTLLPSWKRSGERIPHRYPSVSNTSIADSYTLFPFDPNRSDSLQLRRLGLSAFHVRNILKYRSRGGVFRTRAAFGRLYGLSTEKYQELYPYLQLPDTLLPKSSLQSEEPLPRSFPAKLQRGETIELNAADTTLLKRIPGIGSGYARLIAGYRRRLGGFVAVEQLREVERLPDSVVRKAIDYLTLTSDSLVTINLNVASIERMQAHPYLNFYQAKAIVEYRRRHGPIHSLNTFRLYDEFTPNDLLRLQPYVRF